MTSHQVELGGRTIRYFQANGSDFVGTFAQAHRQGRLVAVLGPTGHGKTTFLDFACARCFGSHLLQVMAYGRRYGCEAPGASAERVLSVADSLRPGDFLSVAFYPKSAEVAKATGGDSWPECRAAIEQILSGLQERGLLTRLAALELSVEPEFVDIYTDIRSLAEQRDWSLLEFLEWDTTTQNAYMDFLFGCGKDSG